MEPFQFVTDSVINMMHHFATSVLVRYLESPLLIDLVLKTNENLKPLDLIFSCCHFVVQALNFVVQVLNEKSIFLPCDIISNNAD